MIHNHRNRNTYISLITAFALMAVGYTVFISLAATPEIKVEPENSTLSNPELAISDSGASGGKAVLFKEITSTGGGATGGGTSGGGTGGSFLIAAAGDIAQNSGAEKGTSDIIYNDTSINTVLTLGDNAYENGLIDEFTQKYEPTWGRFKDKTKPSPGNHEYQSGGAGYYEYFQGVQQYYSFDVNDWHFVSLNGDIDHSASSTQVTWLKNDLAASTKKCTLAYWHEPRFTAGSHDDDTSMTPFWDAFYASGVDVVLNGHSHTYERFAPSKPDGSVDAVNGIREFVVGTGGADMSQGGNTVATREFSDASNYGVLKMNLSATGYDWKFITSGGQTIDPGTGTCH